MGGVKNLKKPNEGMFGTFKGKPKELLTETQKAQAEKGELEGLRFIRKKYNIKARKVYPREQALLAQEKADQDASVNKKTLLGG
tara:strand:+ start:2196 stop:2447 length:252 start_codon:yes stop_codon:yes gene_type:complete